jgi:hypothetical protein
MAIKRPTVQMLKDGFVHETKRFDVRCIDCAVKITLKNETVRKDGDTRFDCYGRQWCKTCSATRDSEANGWEGVVFGLSYQSKEGA